MVGNLAVAAGVLVEYFLEGPNRDDATEMLKYCNIKSGFFFFFLVNEEEKRERENVC